jgi:probable HAF family extracellular repeat protein
VLFRDGMAVDLLGSTPGQGQAAGLNDLGWVVGSLSDAPGGPFTGFLYRDGQMYDVNDLLGVRDAQRWSLDSAFQVNNVGQLLVAGTARSDSSLMMQALLTPVPEPQSGLLMLAGLGLLGAVARGHCKANSMSGTHRRLMPA